MSSLTVTRRENEGVLIGDDIEVTVIRVSQLRVRLRVTAPLERRVSRSEKADKSQPQRRREFDKRARERTMKSLVRPITEAVTGRTLLATTLRDGRQAEALIGDDRQIYLKVDGAPLKYLDLNRLFEAVSV